jgi:DNA-binding transcriptional MerR regulator
MRTPLWSVTLEISGSRTLEQAFTADQASRLSGCTHHQLRYWDRVSLVSPSVQNTGGRPGVRRLYSFRDLVALRVVRSLLDNGMSLQRVRRAWDYLRREGGMDDHLAQVKLITDGQSIFKVSRDDGELLDALREGQLAFFVAIDEIAREVEEDVTYFELDRQQFLDMLRRVEDDVKEEKATGT